MKKKLKYIISTLIVAVIILFEIVSISQAANYNQIEKLLVDKQGAIGKTIGTIGKNSSNINLINGKYLYCVQRFVSAGENNTYKVKKYIEIEGNTAKIYNSSNSNPTTFTDDSNAVLAYILGGGTYDKGFGKDAELGINPRQLALWMYWNTWTEKAKNSFGGTNYTHSDNDGITPMTLGQDLYDKAVNLIKNGENYSKNPGTIASIKMTNSNNNKANLVGTSDDKELVGPIKLNFKGNLSSITIKATDNSQITNYEIYDKNKNKLSGLGSIKSDIEFYIKNTSNKKVENISFNVTASETIKAKIYIIENEKKSTQRLIIADTEKNPTSASVTVNVSREEEGNLKLHKQDSATKKELTGAKFKFNTGTNKDNLGGHWLGIDSTGAYNYDVSYDRATEFTVDGNGNIEIKNLKKGTSITAYETKAPEGYDLTVQKNYDKWAYETSKIHRVRCNLIPQIIKKDTTILVNVENSKTGDLEIIKKDKKTAEKLTGAEFKISVDAEGNKDKNTWLKQNSDGTYNYTSSFNNATTFKVTNGTIQIKELDTKTYYIYETKAPAKYTLEKQEGYNENNKWVKCKDTSTNRYDIKIDSGKTVSVSIENEETTGNLEIIKQDKTTGEKLAGAEFKISAAKAGTKNKNESIWLKKNNDGTYSYTEKFENATTFIADSNGKATIENVEEQRYYIYETKAPSGYDITAQDQYDSNEGWVAVGSTNVRSGETVQVSLPNTEYIAIEGYVWIEKPSTKANDYNDIYDNAEEIITNNVKITLRNKSNNEIVAENPIIKTENGKAIYRFEKVDFKKLNEYYVHFDYSEKYKKYITVSANFEKAEGSKAISDSVPDHDNELTGKASTYKGTTEEAKYGLSGLAGKFYDKNTYTLKNINLGIKELPNTPFTVSENLAYMDLKLKGYNYRYIYGDTGKTISTVPGVNWQAKTDKGSYTRAIYPADILYEDSDKTRELQVYVTYRIDVTNNTSIDVPYLYQEKGLYVTKITNKFDTNRYELADTEKNWKKTDVADVIEIEESYLRSQYYERNELGISNESDKNKKYGYVTFKIKDEELKRLLRSGIKETIEDFPTTAEVTAYHKYTRMDYSWSNNLVKTQNHRTPETTATDSAPYLKLKLADNRNLSGKVFEDTKDASRKNELVGNGIYDENENKVKGVKVELGNYDSNNNFVPTDLYQAIESSGRLILKLDENGNPIKATTITGEDGTYKFEGVVPGEYLLRYTYGDGTQEIVNAEGNKKVYSNKYKSTIVTNEVRQAFETNFEPTKATWYLGIGENHNMGLDDINIRKSLSENQYEVNAGDEYKNDDRAIIASTKEFSIPIEYYANIVKYLDSNNKEVGEGYGSPVAENDEKLKEFPAELGYFDFGIIEMPKIRLEINKKITKVKLTLQNGQILLEGNPATQNVAYTTDLDKKTEGGSTYVKMELDSNNIYGGTLEIKYEIEVINNSDLDYIGDNYYKYGDNSNATEKKVEVKQIYDYLDPKLSYKSKEGTQTLTTININEFRNKDENLKTDNEKIMLALIEAVEDEYNKKLETLLKIEEFGSLSSSKGTNKDNSRSTISINAEKVLSANEDDLEFINIAEITKIKAEPITPANVELPEAEKTNTEIGIKLGKTKKVVLTITPSTGEDRSMIYFITGTIALLVTATGIALIRRNSKK